MVFFERGFPRAFVLIPVRALARALLERRCRIDADAPTNRVHVPDSEHGSLVRREERVTVWPTRTQTQTQTPCLITAQCRLGVRVCSPPHASPRLLVLLASPATRRATGNRERALRILVLVYRRLCPASRDFSPYPDPGGSSYPLT